MKLENMDITLNDANGGDELSFHSISDEARESGDGDSGAESKENVEYDQTPNYQTAESKKPKRASKIPVRQVKLPHHKNVKASPEDSGKQPIEFNQPDAEIEPGILKDPQIETSTDSVIIEAPEEFRQVDISAQPEERHPDSVERDFDNACKPETGDTSRRAVEKEGILESVGLANDHENNARHVGSTAPIETTMEVSTVREDPPQPTTTGASIEVGVAECAQASGCSRVSAAKVCAVDPGHPNSSCAQKSGACDVKNLSWSFRNGRLVFEESLEESDDSIEDSDQVLCSRDLNRRIDESRSRLKYLEQKLKEAGIVDEQVVDKLPVLENYDANQNLLDRNEQEEIIPEGSDTVDFAGSCEFDVREFDATGFWYDEDDTDDSDCEIIIKKKPAMRGDGNMGMDSDRTKHNPDRDNLKSLLKRPGKGRDKRTNRVVFNENKNEFFDADYIILIREECDYDEEDDDGVCTCNQHEMVRLTCCEPNCNCYDGYEQTPQSPKFAPPLEFVDAVTLSPPEGYKDMELEEQQLLALQQMARRGQRAAVCRECSAHEDDDDGDGFHSDNEVGSDREEQEEKEKTDQSQQTTPTTPPNDSDSPNSQRFILETNTMTTEQNILREDADERKTLTNVPPGGSPINGILKGGRLWKQQSLEATSAKPPEPQQTSDANAGSDEEGSNRRSVRFIESEQTKRDSCDGASDNATEEDSGSKEQTKESENSSISPESTEMMLTFKLGNHVLISNNSLKPNSAVRQLFPCTKALNGKEEESIHQYLVTAESLRAFEEAKRSKLPQIIQSGETDESIKRAIERNTLRRSLIRYEPRSKKSTQKTDNSLVERIKQLTCDVDDINQTEEISQRTSPPGEEARNSPEIQKNSNFSPSSSSTASSNSSSTSSTYKKITDLFAKKEEQSKIMPLPDLGNGASHLHEISEANYGTAAKVNSVNSESRKQFLSSLAPLTACVSSLGNGEEHYYAGTHNGERTSLASSTGTEYSLEDIEEGLKHNGEEEPKKIAPDVLAGTPSASESGDELAMFVQQDASRIERIKKKYQPEPANKDEDDEHDDYGFNRRPSVRGIKPRFGSTTEILQQIQNQLQPPAPTARVPWPYYSESGIDNKPRNINQSNYQYPEEVKGRMVPPQYRPTSLQDENTYQNCANQRCTREVYRVNGNQTYALKVSGGCEYYQSPVRARNGRPLSPPPLDVSKNYHQTMVYIPYNHLEGYQQPYYQSDYVRVSNQNLINKRYIEPIYQQRIHVEEHYGSLKPMVRMPPPSHLMTRSESPIPGQFSTARSTQTPLPSASGNYYSTPRYRPMVWPNDCNYAKINRHSYPSRYTHGDTSSLTDSDSQISNGYSGSSPTKPRFLERGVPEGAASIPAQNTTSSSSTMTSPTSPQNNPPQKPLFYSMNV